MREIIQNSTDAIDVLNNIKYLRSFNGEEKEFWKYYSETIIKLLKSSFAIILKKDSIDSSNLNLIELIDDIDLNSKLQEVENVIGQNINKTIQKGYSYGPLGFKIDGLSKPFFLSFEIESGDDEIIVCTIIIDRVNIQYFNEIVLRTQLINDVYINYKDYNYNQNLPVVNNNESNPELYNILELINLIKDERKFLLACMKLVNELAIKFDCSRVTLGWKTNEYINCIAVSHLEKFDKKSEVIKQLQDAYEECADQEKSIVLPSEDENILTLAHEEYQNKNSLNSLVSIPIIYNSEVYGVVTLENEKAEFEQRDITLLNLSFLQLNVWLFDLYEDDKWLGKKILDKSKKGLSKFLGSDNTFAKLIGIVVSILFLYSIFFKWDYKIEVTATLDTDSIAYIQAPYDSYIKNVNYYPGEFVKKDETVIELDKEELLLKKLEMESDVVRYRREAEKARARGKLADMNIAIAKVIQAQASLKKVEYYLNYSQVKSPFDGVVVEGNKKELLSSPVSKGDMLLKIANSNDIFIKFKISEKYIDEINLEDMGELKLLSKPENYYPIKVMNIVPVAQVDKNNGNIFVLKAKALNGVESWWRPGMSGVAKINVGKRRVIWIITHSTIDFLRMFFWL
ncbi:MAG: efflux RND transporter periplasmic adaptor subunit [Campylobacterota bacterium]